MGPIDMNVTALIAEDEGPQRRALARLLASAWPQLRIVAECANGTSALAALEAQRPTIAFLDIRMAGKDGIAVAQQAGPATQIVFTTAYEQHAVRAFELGAVDYILKPVTAERLGATLDRVRARLAPIREDSDAPSTSGALPRLSWITACVGNQVKLIAVEDVVFFQAGDSCTRVVTATEEAIIRTPLREILKRLDPDKFWQIHRSFIVQLSAIAAVRRDELGKLEIELRGREEVIPVSQSFQSRFRGM
jgi:DNA-binding LytR/AlgR family response regulator